MFKNQMTQWMTGILCVVLSLCLVVILFSETEMGSKEIISEEITTLKQNCIRVVLMNTGYQSIYHDSVRLKFLGDTAVYSGTTGEKTEVVQAGMEWYVSKDDKRVQKDYLIFRPLDAEKEVEIRSMERNLGYPSYSGLIEIRKADDGLVVVNEVPLESYLEKVIPSEIPSGYEMEALKAQAVCARSYAYRQMQKTAYSSYHAHVDDSVNYQVYNNERTTDRIREAVLNTAGEMLWNHDNVITAYYFSTSCGYTTDAGVWGEDDVPYIKSIRNWSDGETRLFRDNQDFMSFITAEQTPAYDAEFPLYRWQTVVTAKQLSERVSDSEIGRVTNIQVTDRRPGGAANELKVTGTNGENVIDSETAIRKFLGNTDLEIVKADGGMITGWELLPSAFFAVEKKTLESTGEIQFVLYGGGFGHGVGMSQNGAQGMAELGYGYQDILKFYYRNVTIKTRE